MPHYKTMYDESDFLFAHDLGGKSHVVTISKVEAGKVTGTKGKSNKKPILHFAGRRKKLAINKTNGRVIAKMYGDETNGWVGKNIEIYPTVTEFGGEEVPCIRVKSKVPSGPAANQPQQSEAAEPAATEAES